MSRVVPAEQVVDTAIEIAAKIASYSSPVVCLAKQAVNAAYEVNLHSGIEYEKVCPVEVALQTTMTLTG